MKFCAQNGEIFVFFLFVESQFLCLISLKLTFGKVAKGLLQDLIYDHIVSYLLWYFKQIRMILVFAVFSSPGIFFSFKVS